MTVNIAAWDRALKEVYRGQLHEQTKRVSNGLQLIEETTNNTDLTNLEARIGIELETGFNVASRWEDEDFPATSAPIMEQAILRLRKLVAVSNVTPEAVKRSQASEAAFVSAMEKETSSIAKQMGYEKARQVFGAGGGVVAVCDDNTGNVIDLAAATTAAEMRTFRRGLRVDLGTVANPTSVAANRRITAVDRTNKTITVDGATIVNSTIDGTHRVTIQGAGGSTSWATREVTSLQQIVGTGNYLGVNTTNNPEFVSIVDTASSNRVLTEALVSKVRDDVRMVAGDVPDTIITSPGVFRAATAAFVNQIEYVMNDQELLKAGIKAIELGGIRVVQDDYVWDNTAFMLNLKDEAGVKVYTDGEGVQEVDETWRRLEGRDTFRKRLCTYWELGTEKRTLHARFTHLTEA
jgi:uncharacterized FlaG/YvyC family protein